MSFVEVSSQDPKYLLNQLALARREINNLRQQLTNLTHVHKKECELISQKLEDWQCLTCRKMQQSSRNETSENRHDFEVDYIGTINTSFPEKRGTPRQPGIVSDMTAKLTLNNSVFTNPSHTLEGLQEFSHMWILFHFHRNESTHVRAKVAPPRLNGIRTGVFATRSPHRPCPIGLSLVKIDRIMDNTIYFSGVDMINETPVLDIKPYIPQYDNPTLMNMNYQGNPSDLPGSIFELSNSTRDLNLSEAGTSSSRLENFTSTPSSLLGDFTGTSTSLLDNSTNRLMDGEENGHRENVMGASVTENSQSRMEESFYSRTASRIGEREAPDGEEEEPPRGAQAALTMIAVTTTPDRQIRVPSWIDQPPVPRLSVLFKERALTHLSQLGPEGEEKKKIITNVLREDPRSVYLRERWGSHCYVFRIAELYVSCKFNDSSKSVTVYQVFQSEEPAEHED